MTADALAHGWAVAAAVAGVCCVDRRRRPAASALDAAMGLVMIAAMVGAAIGVLAPVLAAAACVAVAFGMLLAAIRAGAADRSAAAYEAVGAVAMGFLLVAMAMDGTSSASHHGVPAAALSVVAIVGALGYAAAAVPRMTATRGWVARARPAASAASVVAMAAALVLAV